MKNKIILATANSKKELYSVTADDFSAIAPNIQLGLLGSYIKSKGIDIDLVDSETDRISIDQLIGTVENEQPLLLGLIATGANPSSSTMSMVGIINFFEKFNRLNSKVRTFIWGPHPTVLPERSLRETGADFIVRGEGYEAITELFHALVKNRGIEGIPGLSYPVKNNTEVKYAHNKPASLINNLDRLPMIDWEIMNPAKYRAHNWHCFGDINNRSPYAIIWTSFGCPFRCIYCCINNLFGRRVQRFRSVDNVINEISILVEKYKVRHLKVLDELFVINPERIKEFCDKLEEKNYDLNMWSYARVDTVNSYLLKRLKKVGMNWLSYGFESAQASALSNIKKGYAINKAEEVIKITHGEGIAICADVMFGLPDDDTETMEQTYDFLVKHNFEWANIYPMFAYPGTALYAGAQVTKPWKNYSLYGYECFPMGTKYLAPKEVLKFRDEAFIRYHSRTEYLDMIENKFGGETRKHIKKILRVPLRRRLLEETQ